MSRQGIHTNRIEGLFGSLKKLAREYDSYWAGVTNLNSFLSNSVSDIHIVLGTERKPF